MIALLVCRTALTRICCDDIIQDGTCFDSSRKRGKTFEFMLGAEQVIKGVSWCQNRLCCARSLTCVVSLQAWRWESRRWRQDLSGLLVCFQHAVYWLYIFRLPSRHLWWLYPDWTQLSKGDKAKVTIPSRLGWGSKGFPGLWVCVLLPVGLKDARAHTHSIYSIHSIYSDNGLGTSAKVVLSCPPNYFFFL